MAKRKQSKYAAGKGTKVGASATVTALFEKTRRRIKEIEKRALAKLPGKDTDK